MSTPAPVAPRPKAEPHSVPFTLTAIMLALGMVGLASVYGFEMLLAHLRGRQVAEDTPPIAMKLVGKQLSIPAAWLRDPPPRQQGFATQVSFEVVLPLGKAGAPALVDVTLLPLSQARPSANLLDGVYLHQFMPNELAGPPGLVGKPLYGTEGYQNEAVWYDALSQNPFVAKCIAPPAQEAGPARCLRTVALPDGIAAVYSFDSDLLYAWRSFDAEMRKRLSQVGAV